MVHSVRIILASRSPARQKLMQELKLPFECYPSGYHEDMSAYKSPARLAKFLALGKAQFIAAKFPNAIIIGADTFITLGKNKIGKPTSTTHAKRIIRSMSDKVIGVYSGIAVIKTDAKGTIIKELTSHVLTKLTIKKMTAAEIHTLATQKDALQISGAFGIEGEGGRMVTKITGDYNNVIGLPLFKLKELLKFYL